MSGPQRVASQRYGPPDGRSDAVRNYHRIVQAAREVFGEFGADACVEQIAERAGVGVGTVYRRFAGKEALIEELLHLVRKEMLESTERALRRADGQGLEDLLRAVGESFTEHRRYADLLLENPSGDRAARQFRAAIAELTRRAVDAGTLNQNVTLGDVMALVWAMRGLVQSAGEVAPQAWRRFLDIHLAGMRSDGPVSATRPISDRQLARLAPRGAVDLSSRP